MEAMEVGLLCEELDCVGRREVEAADRRFLL